MRRVLVLAAGVAVVAAGATATVMAIPGSDPTPNVSAAADECTVEPGKLPPGRYEAPLAISRQVDGDRDAGPVVGKVHDEQVETGTMNLQLAVSRSQEIHGTWELESNLTSTITVQRNGEKWITPGVLQVAGGKVGGNATELHLTGGNGQVTHYPAAGVVSRYPIVAGVADYTPYLGKETIDVVVKLGDVSCDQISGEVSYPIGLSGNDKAPQPQPWTAPRTPAPCDEEPRIAITEKPNHADVVAATDFRKYALPNPIVGRVEFYPRFAIKWKTNPTTLAIERAGVSIPLTLIRPTWRLMPGAKISAEYTKAFDKIVNMVRVHEARHIADIERIARKWVCDTHGKSPTTADDMEQQLYCDIIRAARTFDRASGHLSIIVDEQKVPVDAIYKPETDESTLTSLKTPLGMCTE